MSEYIDFIAYQDDAIIQRPLRYYRRRGQPKGDLHQGNGHRKTVLITMITSYGLAPGGYSDDIQCQLTMADLFRYKPTSQKW